MPQTLSPWAGGAESGDVPTGPANASGSRGTCGTALPAQRAPGAAQHPRRVQTEQTVICKITLGFNRAGTTAAGAAAPRLPRR